MPAIIPRLSYISPRLQASVLRNAQLHTTTSRALYIPHTDAPRAPAAAPHRFTDFTSASSDLKNLASFLSSSSMLQPRASFLRQHGPWAMLRGVRWAWLTTHA